MFMKGSSRRDGYGTRRKFTPKAGRVPWAGKYMLASRRRTPTAGRAAVDTEALVVASRIASMADGEVRQRYHELVDKRLESELTVLERFEL